MAINGLQTSNIYLAFVSIGREQQQLRWFHISKKAQLIQKNTDRSQIKGLRFCICLSSLIIKILN